MNFSSSNTCESKAYPGVTFKVRRLSEGKRIALAARLEKPYAEIEDKSRMVSSLRDRLIPIIQESKTATPERLAEINAMRDVIEAARANAAIEAAHRNMIAPVYVRELLAGIDGLTVDGEPVVCADALIDLGPRELYDEIAAECMREVGMSEAEAKNSASLTTLPVRVDGETNRTSADTV